MKLLEKLKNLFKKEEIVDERVGVSDLALGSVFDPLDGLYYSKITGKIFEAETFGGTVFVQYADTLETKTIPSWMFEYQALSANVYEPLVIYGKEL